MSIVLYALGAGLLAWGGLMLLSGEAYAAIDIAAGLAGSGAVAIGLGAVAGAIARLAKAIKGEKVAAARPESAAPGRRSEEAREEIVPVFVARGPGPAHFEPAPEPVVEPDRPVPKPEAMQARESGSVESRLQPTESRAEPPASSPPGTPTVSVPASDEAEDNDAQGLTRRERRARRLAAKQAAERRQSGAALGGDLPAGVELAPHNDQEASEPSIESGSGAAATSGETTGEGAATPAADAPRLIMPMRPSPRPAETDAEPPATDAPSAEAPSETPPPVAAAPVVEPKFREPEPPSGTASQPAVETPPTAVVAPSVEPAPEAPRPDPAPEPEEQSAPPSPGPEERPKSPTIVVEPKAVPASPSPAEPRVPEWLARARARREARAKAEAEARSGPSRPRQPEEPQAAPRPVFLGPDPVAGSEPPQPEPTAQPETAVEAPSIRQIVREGEHNGVLYRFFDDGAVEAVSAHGVRRFASVEELRSTVTAARGETPIVEEPADVGDSDPASVAPPGPGSKSDSDPLDEALAELEGRHAAAPELKIDPQDRLGPTPGRR